MSDIVKILMVDDDEEDFFIIRDNLMDISKRKYQLEWVSGYEKGLKVVEQKGHDVYLIDYRLGKDNGLDLIKEAIKSGCEAPLILLTGQGDTVIDEQAMNAGAADYLVKGVSTPSSLLERAIRYSIQHAKSLKKIKILNADLENRVEERTRELTESYKILEHINKKLIWEIEEKEKAKQETRQALEKEKELSELKSRFVSMASHEFRTPLTTILSSVALISKYNEQESAKEKIAIHVQKIRGTVGNLTQILNDLLSIGKLEEGGIENYPEQFSIISFSDEIRQYMQEVTKEKQQIVYKHLGEKSEVYLDKKLLKNIFINLLSNAIKYSPEGKNIFIVTEVSGKHTTISVRDEGMGISEEDQKHLFDRFFRGENVVNIEGTGLGLNIIKKYLDLMEGSIKFESKLGKGTVFTIHF